MKDYYRPVNYIEGSLLQSGMGTLKADALADVRVRESYCVSGLGKGVATRSSGLSRNMCPRSTAFIIITHDSRFKVIAHYIL